MIIPKPVGSKWSDDQWNAISLAGGNMLVAAAAGSGKTAVLVERIIRKISDGTAPLSVDRLLVATFTKAAASEMRERIRTALEQLLETEPENEHVSRQLAMLGRASITTLHSFCLEVIQRYYTLIPLDPGFRIATESDVKLLRQEVLEELFEEKYGTETEGGAFLSLVDWFSGERSDDAMFLLVQRLYDFSRSHSWPDHWLRSTAALFETADMAGMSQSPWVKSILADTRLTLSGVADLLKQAKEMALSPGGPAPYAVSLDEDLEVVEGLIEAVLYQPWDHLYNVFQYSGFGKLKPCKKDQTDPVLQERVKSLREEAKKTIAELRGQLFGRSAEAFVHELHQAAPLMKELAELIILFGQRYQKEKKSRGWLDFSDLEHYCLQILRNPDSTPEHTIPSPAALEYQAQYEEVLLDEYQDTNTVQEDIVRLISRSAPGNRFMVGDVKQSIYRFRLAEPGLFLDKYKTYGSDFTGEGLRIDLARNFRSRKHVVDAVNLLFRQLMNESVAEISYDERAELVYGEGYPDQGDEPSYVPELLLIDRSRPEQARREEAVEAVLEEESGQEEAEELEAVRLEARMIAARIREMLGEGGRPLQIYDKTAKELRPVQYRDMVILLRSTLSWAPAMIQELRLEGIPAYGELSQGYFQASEVEIMLSVLQVIDNPQQDIPLASVLRSPLYGLTEEELAQVRLANPGTGFYEAVAAAASSSEGPLADKLGTFLSNLENWRTEARHGELGALIWNIYRETGYLDWVGGLPGGAQRQANLKALYDRARQYEQSTSSRGLFRFLRFISRLRENGGDFGAPGAGNEQSDGIRIMTIHKSKGLEFPVVFVAGLSKMFNRQDMNASFLMHKELGFGPKFVDSSTRVSYPTLPNLAIRRRANMELLAEELRVLYVALTRPKDKLVLVSSVKDLTKAVLTWGQALQSPGEMLPDYMIARGRSYLDWIGPALIRHPAAASLRALADVPEGSAPLLPVPAAGWRIGVLSSQMLLKQAAASAEISEDSEAMGERAALQALLSGQPVLVTKADPGLADAVNSRLAWSYPYAAASRIPAKTTVTEMKTLLAAQDDPPVNVLEGRELRQEADRRQGSAAAKLHLERPKFMEQRRMTPTERGTAYHTVMQHIPVDTDQVEGVVEETLQRLVDRKIMLAEQAAELDAGRITDFLRSSLGERLREAEWVQRELAFSYGVRASEAYPDLTGINDSLEEQGRFQLEALKELDQETVLVQGIIDCLFCHNGKWVLLDYKSDRVLEHQGGMEALKEKYRFQLELYAKALEDISGVPVDEKWLYFFDNGEAVQV
ncbi:helicase-exonuclease AddAB subunit AddA [Paenibacillus sp. J22TS3]|uniref:helicase-exonuclease AddAB subunit AddA n=1 Tax=Paenibacillus sp. J22TS3 TaxID=2807192 RepID=UPI001B282B31|nr:helicase-exonuclease AddAB subunit AddA [Paenibacillus sp. J22TS3]GIP20543.1 ATP-dependent helicase/nuclease subunit A [Paenibacillus sp. J22TS3]